MISISGLRMSLDYTEIELLKKAAQSLKISFGDILSLNLLKKSIDARHKNNIVFNISVEVKVKGGEDKILRNCANPNVKKVIKDPYIIPAKKAKGLRPIVVGGGPAGLFAALVLARSGLNPILLERGRAVEERIVDVNQFRKTGILDFNSNVQFGEGGAGTFSDGKLNTGISNPRCRFVMQEMVAAGAPQQILWQAKPHVGTDKLYDMVKGLRANIISAGGEVYFSHQVTKLIINKGIVRGLEITTPQGKTELSADRIILAIGHSARDTMKMLFENRIPMQQKPFAVGVRIEHPRTMIDNVRYGRCAGHPALGAADYKLSCRPADKRGVYTFCMCPGGVVIAAASEEGGLVVNGMSEFARDAANSNSAVLVGVGPGDFGSDHALAGVEFQRNIERAAFKLGGGKYHAPAQMVGDFLKGRASKGWGNVQPSYMPGVTPADLHECLPRFITESLEEGIPLLGNKLKGFDRFDAVLTGVETRSSSPVRILRGDDAQSDVKGIFPCGEGAGYAGGIVSAAVDGIFCAEQLIASLDMK